MSTALVLGFNLVATAPSLTVAMGGWSLIGFASTFLIGTYNERPTVRNNATFAFACYQISDFAMLMAVAFSGFGESHPLVAAGLLASALLKSSQFPMTSLFARSMEGPTPASALGYAGKKGRLKICIFIFISFPRAFCSRGGGIVDKHSSTLV